MKKRWNWRTFSIVMAVEIALVGLIACAYLFWIPEEKPSDEITVTFFENGFDQKGVDVRISNMGPGKQVDINYHIVNNTQKSLTPGFDVVFKVNPDDYSLIEGKGYVAVPEWFRDWVVIPPTGPIAPGMGARYQVRLYLPMTAQSMADIPPKWAFQTVAFNDNGAFKQMAPGVWWIIDMET